MTIIHNIIIIELEFINAILKRIILYNNSDNIDDRDTIGNRLRYLFGI